MSSATKGTSSEARHMPLRILMAAAVLVPMTVFVIVGYFSNQSADEDTRQTIEGTATVLREHALKVFETVELLAKSIDDLLDNRLGEQNLADNGLTRLTLGILRQLEQVQAAWVVAADGSTVMALGDPLVADELDQSAQQYFTVFLGPDPPEEFVSRVYAAGDEVGRPFFVYSRPRYVDGDFRGVIAVAVSSPYFSAVYADLAQGTDLIAGLVRSDGSILALYPYADVNLADVPPVQSFADAIQTLPLRGTYSVPGGVDGAPSLISFHRIGAHDVYVAAALSLRAVHATWLGAMLRIFAFMIPVMIALVYLSWVALRRTQRESAALDALKLETALREEKEQQLLQANKMEAVGQLSGGIAHDFNNLLMVVGGNLELLGRKLGAGNDNLMRYVNASQEAVKRAARLTQRLLAFSRRQALQPTDVDPNNLLSGMSDLLRRTLGEQIDIAILPGVEVWPILVDGNQLENAVLNLTINARDAMPGGGKLTIETGNVDIDENYVTRLQLGDVKTGPYVMIAVSDTGIGMSPDVVGKAFDPFFTTKGVGEGTGLGLSMVYGFVKQSGGHARIYSEQGHGTTIRLYLPRAFGAVKVERPPVLQVPDAPGNGETILVVEDEPDVLAFEVETLTTAGYRVRQARTGRAAIAELEADPNVDLLLTDVVLAEGMNGREVADNALRINPNIRLLFATGYTRNAIVHHGRLDQGVTLLSKPFSTSELLTKVRAILAGSQEPEKMLGNS